MNPQNRAQRRWLKKHKMNPKDPNQPTEEEKKVFEAAMDEEHTISLKKKELIVIFNILCKIDMKYGDSLIIAPIVQKLEPIVAVESNITERVEKAESNHKESIIIGGKKN